MTTDEAGQRPRGKGRFERKSEKDLFFDTASIQMEGGTHTCLTCRSPGRGCQRCSFSFLPLSNKIVSFQWACTRGVGVRKHRKNPSKWWDEFSFKGTVQTGTNNKNRVGPFLLRAVIGRVAWHMTGMNSFFSRKRLKGRDKKSKLKNHKTKSVWVKEQEKERERERERECEKERKRECEKERERKREQKKKSK